MFFTTSHPIQFSDDDQHLEIDIESVGEEDQEKEQVDDVQASVSYSYFSFQLPEDLLASEKGMAIMVELVGAAETEKEEEEVLGLLIAIAPSLPPNPSFFYSCLTENHFAIFYTLLRRHRHLHLKNLQLLKNIKLLLT